MLLSLQERELHPISSTTSGDGPEQMKLKHQVGVQLQSWGWGKGKLQGGRLQLCERKNFPREGVPRQPQICQKRLGQALPCQEGFSPEGRLVSINTKSFPDLTLKVSDSWHIGPHWSLGDRDISHPSTHAFTHPSIHSYAAMLSAKDIANFLPGSSQEGQFDSYLQRNEGEPLPHTIIQK